MKNTILILFLFAACMVQGQPYITPDSTLKERIVTASGDTVTLTILEVINSASIVEYAYQKPAETRELALRYLAEYEIQKARADLYEQFYREVTGLNWQQEYKARELPKWTGRYRVNAKGIQGYVIEVRDSGMWRIVGGSNIGNFNPTSQGSFELRNFGGSGNHVTFRLRSGVYYASYNNIQYRIKRL